jgi:hypothetical protein
MPHTLPTQQPAMVLRSNYRQLLALLIVAMIAVIGLSTAVILLADKDYPGRSSLPPVGATVEPSDDPRQLHAPGQQYSVPLESGSREAR